MLRQFHATLQFDTRGRGLMEITRPVSDWLTSTGLATGLLTLFIRHTSASLVVQENADPLVRHDLDRFFARLVPDGDPLFKHRDEGRPTTCPRMRARRLPPSSCRFRLPMDGLRLARGRESICGSIASNRIGANWRFMRWEIEALASRERLARPCRQSTAR
jgi:secondary thiamine-phosphate synthase enzyme